MPGLCRRLGDVLDWSRIVADRRSLAQTVPDRGKLCGADALCVSAAETYFLSPTTD